MYTQLGYILTKDFYYIIGTNRRSQNIFVTKYPRGVYNNYSGVQNIDTIPVKLIIK